MPQTSLDISINSSGTVSGANAINSAVNQVKNNFIDLSAKIFVAQAALHRAFSAAQDGAEFEETMDRLNRQMSQFNQTGSSMVRTLQGVTGGQLSMANAASLASRALLIGLNPSQIKTFTEAAEILSDIMGGTIPQAFDRLVQASATGSQRAIAEMGIFIDLDDALKKLAADTGRTTEQISRQERSMLSANLIAEKLKNGMGQLSDGMSSDADKLKSLEARWEDFGLGMGRTMKNITLGVLNMNSAFQTWFRSVIPFREQLEAIVPKFNLFGPPDQQVPTGVPAPDQQKSPPLPFALRAAQAGAENERDVSQFNSDLERFKAVSAAMQQTIDMDQQQGLLTVVEATQKRGAIQLGELDAEKQILLRTRDSYDAYYKYLLQSEGISTEERMGVQRDYANKIFELNQKLQTNDAATATARKLNEAQTTLAIWQNRIAVDTENYRLVESMRQQDMQGVEAYYQGEIDLINARFGTDQQVAAKQRELLREQLAFKLRISQGEASQVLTQGAAGNTAGVSAILRNADPALTSRQRQGIASTATAQDIELAERANNDFFAGWARGMQGYRQNAQVGFNLASDMARRTAQTMETGFQQFFFAPMEQGWKGMLDNLLTMTKQVVSQIMAQLATNQVLQILEAAAGGVKNLFPIGANPQTTGPVQNGSFFSGFQEIPTGASGLVGDFGSGSLALLHHKEAVVPLPDGRSIPVMMSGGGGGGVSMPITIINQAGADISTQQGTSASGGPSLEVLVARSVTKSISEGRMDKALQSRFKLTPGGG